MFPFKVDVRDFKDETSWSLLREALNIDSYNEMLDTGYVLINEDRMKLPQPRERADPSISFKFLENPV